jgi:TBC1 domain family member 2B
MRFKKQINLDLLRTMPNNIKFSECYSEGVKQLQEVLEAFCVHNPSIGYCQGTHN